MEEQMITFGSEKTNFLFDGEKSKLSTLPNSSQIVILTDDNLFPYYKDFLSDFQVIVIPTGEASKQLNTVEIICERLIGLQIDRNGLLIGFGGGVVCDIAGFVAGVYKRGIRCAFLPTSILAMVDAAIGGKNGVNVGNNKNMIGLFRQPEFVLYDYALLRTLPDDEWTNGFAEIIKHACIADIEMFEILSTQNLSNFKEKKSLLAALIKRNVLLKAGFVQRDTLEDGERKKLNFGHTLAHAIERTLNLKHGFAVAVGMVFAAGISENKLNFRQTNNLIRLLENYQLPTTLDFPAEETFQLLRSDKKCFQNEIHFILLEEIGKPVIYPLHLLDLQKSLSQWKQP